MKNTLLAFATALICAGTATAQKMDAYDMQVSQGTYQEITDGTVVSVEDEGEYFAGLVIDGSGEADIASLSQEMVFL